jgi:F-type H+-transporting ATPase subunit epsilon
MAGTFKFELVTPERMLIPAPSDDPKSPAVAEAEQVVVPGLDGQFTVLAGHAPTLSALKPGVLEIKLTTGMRRVFVRGGFAEVEPDRLTILAQHLIDLDAKDGQKVKAEIEAARAELGDAKDDAARFLAQATIGELADLDV